MNTKYAYSCMDRHTLATEVVVCPVADANYRS